MRIFTDESSAELFVSKAGTPGAIDIDRMGELVTEFQTRQGLALATDIERIMDPLVAGDDVMFALNAQVALASSLLASALVTAHQQLAPGSEDEVLDLFSKTLAKMRRIGIGQELG